MLHMSAQVQLQLGSYIHTFMHKLDETHYLASLQLACSQIGLNLVEVLSFMHATRLQLKYKISISISCKVRNTDGNFSGSFIYGEGIT